MIIPGGLSSEAPLKDAKFCVQTEFAQRPRPRVTTTISLNGQVVEKVENIWERLPQTEEDKQEIERFLKRQHQQVLEKIKDRSERRASPEWEKEEIAPSEEPVFLKVNQELIRFDGVLGWVFILQDGQMLTHRITGSDDKERIRQIKDLSLFLPLVSRLGKFVGGILDSPGSFLLFLPLRKHYLAVQLDPKVDSKNLVKRIKSMV